MRSELELRSKDGPISWNFFRQKRGKRAHSTFNIVQAFAPETKPLAKNDCTGAYKCLCTGQTETTKASESIDTVHNGPHLADLVNRAPGETAVKQTRCWMFRGTLNTSYITGLDMCEVCTEAVHSAEPENDHSFRNVSGKKNASNVCCQAQNLCVWKEKTLQTCVAKHKMLSKWRKYQCLQTREVHRNTRPSVARLPTTYTPEN